MRLQRLITEVLRLVLWPSLRLTGHRLKRSRNGNAKSKMNVGIFRWFWCKTKLIYYMNLRWTSESYIAYLFILRAWLKPAFWTEGSMLWILTMLYTKQINFSSTNEAICFKASSTTTYYILDCLEQLTSTTSIISLNCIIFEAALNDL